MRSVRRLQRLAEYADWRFRCLEAFAANLRGSNPRIGDGVAERGGARMCIDVQSYWSNWSRAYYLSCAVGCRSIAGNRISSALGQPLNENQALAIAVRYYRRNASPLPNGLFPGHFEPKWFDPTVLISVANAAGLSNLATIQSAFTNRADVFADLRQMRNYFAHRCEQLHAESLQLAPKYLVGNPKQPAEIIWHVGASSVISVIEGWVSHIRQVALFLCA
jgi:hypothetical protein